MLVHQRVNGKMPSLMGPRNLGSEDFGLCFGHFTYIQGWVSWDMARMSLSVINLNTIPTITQLGHQKHHPRHRFRIHKPQSGMVTICDCGIGLSICTGHGPVEDWDRQGLGIHRREVSEIRARYSGRALHSLWLVPGAKTRGTSPQKKRRKSSHHRRLLDWFRGGSCHRQCGESPKMGYPSSPMVHRPTKSPCWGAIFWTTPWQGVAVSDVLFKSLRRAGWICGLEKAEVQGLDLWRKRSNYQKYVPRMFWFQQPKNHTKADGLNTFQQIFPIFFPSKPKTGWLPYQCARRPDPRVARCNRSVDFDGFWI